MALNIKVLFGLVLVSYLILPILSSQDEEEERYINPELKIETLSDAIFDEIVNNGKNQKWLILFHVETCPHCLRARDAIEKVMKRNAHPEIRFGQVECQSNTWSSIRFNITRIPYIVLIENDQMFEMKAYPGENSIDAFLTEEKLLQDSREIPKALSYYSGFIWITKIGYEMLNELLEDFAVNTLKIEVKWKTLYTNCVIGISLIMIIAIEYFLISCCFRKKQKKIVEAPKEKPEEKKE